MEIQIPEGSKILDALLNTTETWQGASGTVISNATQEQLTSILAAMERGDLEYVTLTDGNHFIQAAGDASGYTLEYNDGSDKVQYRATNRKITGSEIGEALAAYLNRDPQWKTKFSWSEFKL